MKVCKFCKKQFVVKYYWNKNSFCSNRCRLLHGGSFLRSLNKQRTNKTFKEIFGEAKAKEVKIRQSLGVSKNNLKKGVIPPSRKGVKDSLETRNKKSISWKKRLSDIKVLNEHVARWMKSLPKRPTSLEKEMIEIIKESKFPFKYTGDGSFFVSGRNPDFTNKKDKVIIEVANGYHHIKRYGSKDKYVERTTSHYGKNGWRSFVFFFPLDKNLILENLKEWGSR